MCLSLNGTAVAVLLLSCRLVGVDAFSQLLSPSCEYLDTVYSKPQKSLIFPIKPPDVASYNNDGKVKTEIDIGNSLSSAFADVVDSSDFMVSSPYQPPSGHRLSSCRMPAFGEAATVTFAPRQSTCDDNGDPTEYILSAVNFDSPDADFGNLCLEIYKYQDDMKRVVSIADLRDNVLEYLNSLPPDPGFDADLTSSEAIGDPKLGSLINRLVDSEALRKLSEDGFVVIDNVMSTSQSSHDKLDQWTRKSKTDQEHCRTDTVSFLSKDDATECGIEDQYDLLLALASHLNDKLDLYSSPYDPVLPGTAERPLTNPSGSNVQMAEYGFKDFYDPHSDNSIDPKHRFGFVHNEDVDDDCDYEYYSDSGILSGYLSSLSQRENKASTSESGQLPKRRSNYRCLTAILYTNEGWEVSDGGQLRMYRDSQFVEHPNTAKETHQYVDINPSNGKLLLFDSRMVHSVKKVTHQSKIRRALTLWITRPEQSGVTGEEYYLTEDEDENYYFEFA